MTCQDSTRGTHLVFFTTINCLHRAPNKVSPVMPESVVRSKYIMSSLLVASADKTLCEPALCAELIRAAATASSALDRGPSALGPERPSGVV